MAKIQAEERLATTSEQNPAHVQTNYKYVRNYDQQLARITKALWCCTSVLIFKWEIWVETQKITYIDI